MSNILLGIMLLTCLLAAYQPAITIVARWALFVGPIFILSLAVLDKDLWVGFLSLSLAFSTSRFISHRYGFEREQRLMRRSFKWLSILFVLGWLGSLVMPNLSTDWQYWLLSLSFLLIASRSLTLVLWRSRIPRQNTVPKLALPTVTICIPARNETHALTDALRGALASDYPKLEVLVLDDCSQDSTPDIIRAFAQDGVRFIQAKEPAEDWVGKNRAYELLVSEASGDVVLFVGVDIRLQPGSVRQMVNHMQVNNSKIVSVLPRRRSFDFLANAVRPLRYYWQLAFSSWPFAESAWMVDRTWLLKQQGFKPIKHHIRPGRSLAKLARESKEYSFFVSYGEAAITTRKRVASLYETAIRTQYPSLRREPILVLTKVWALMTILVLMALVWRRPVDYPGWIISLSTFTLWLSYTWSELVLQGISGWFSALLAPSAIFGEAISTITSMLRYEFGRVDWKGRNVCLPVMHQHPRSRIGSFRVWRPSKRARQS